MQWHSSSLACTSSHLHPWFAVSFEVNLLNDFTFKLFLTAKFRKRLHITSRGVPGYFCRQIYALAQKLLCVWCCRIVHRVCRCAPHLQLTPSLILEWFYFPTDFFFLISGECYCSIAIKMSSHFKYFNFMYSVFKWVVNCLSTTVLDSYSHAHNCGGIR